MFETKTPYFTHPPYHYQLPSHLYQQPMTRPPYQQQGYMQQQPTGYHVPYQQYMTQMQHPSQKKPSFVKSLFTNNEGKFDMNHTVQTVDQVIKTVNQVSPIIKQVGGLFIKK